MSQALLREEQLKGARASVLRRLERRGRLVEEGVGALQVAGNLREGVAKGDAPLVGGEGVPESVEGAAGLLEPRQRGRRVVEAVEVGVAEVAEVGGLA